MYKQIIFLSSQLTENPLKKLFHQANVTSENRFFKFSQQSINYSSLENNLQGNMVFLYDKHIDIA
jgi:hypothetical protein